ncbi:MAG: hypothetical protein ACO2OW_02585 [Minisyncoccia bacterium]|jgi:hypothetical protein
MIEKLRNPDVNKTRINPPGALSEVIGRIEIPFPLSRLVELFRFFEEFKNKFPDLEINFRDLLRIFADDKIIRHLKEFYEYLSTAIFNSEKLENLKVKLEALGEMLPYPHKESGQALAYVAFIVALAALAAIIIGFFVFDVAAVQNFEKLLRALGADEETLKKFNELVELIRKIYQLFGLADPLRFFKR